MIKNLILTTDTYNWISYCSGLVLQNPEQFELIQIFKDKRKIWSCKFLCNEAIDVQRRYDLFKIGKEIGLKKVSMMNYDASILEIDKLIVQLQLYIYLSNFKSIFCQKGVKYLEEVVSKIVDNTKSDLFFFGNNKDNAEFKMQIEIEDKVLEKKRLLIKLMAGRPYKFFEFSKIERFY